MSNSVVSQDGAPEDPPKAVSEIGAEKTLEALYNLNKHARKYADLADENYRKRKKATAHANSIKKQALYDLKTAILEKLCDSGVHDRVEQHEIDGRTFYCVYFGEWSYHTPVEEWNGPDLEPTEEEQLANFEKESEKKRSDMSLKTSLLHIQSALDLSANDFLEKKRVSWGSERYFIGWEYLD